MADGKRPLGSGFFFSFGHSTIVVAVGVGITEAHLHGAFWSVMANFNINVAGFCIAALFVLVWAAALAYWRWGKVETRWAANVPAVGPARDSGTST
jgi:high-affinity nickel permease